MDTMSLHQGRFATASGVLIVAGKGGVGKTTVAAALATAAARNGASTLLVEIDGTRQLAKLFDVPDLTYEPRRLDLGDTAAPLWGCKITPDHALADYLEGRGLYRALKRVQGDRVLDALASSTPGVKDLLVLGKIRQIEQAGTYDVVIVDAPASGHALTLVRAAAGVLDSVDTGPIREQAVEVAAMLADPDRCQVVLVTLAEETPVSEVIDTAFALEDEIGVALAPLVVNAVLAEAPGSPSGDHLGTVDDETAASLTDAVDFARTRGEARDEQLDRLTRLLPLPRVHLPHLDADSFGRAEIDRLADELAVAADALTDDGVP
jgi:arsenite-transporting ATPase